MKTLIQKAVETALMLAIPVTFIVVAYLLYGQHKPEAHAEETSLYSDTNQQQHNDSVKFSKMQAAIDKELDSIIRYPSGNVLAPLYNNLISDSLQNASLLPKPNNHVPVHDDKTVALGNHTLRGPSALFTRTYSLAINKPVPVSVLWMSDSVSSPVKRQLVTITLNDVAGDKAAFTLSDPSSVLLYSKTNYAANDKISIEDESHSLHISVLEVQPDSVKIQLMSYLNDGIINRLKKME